MSTNESNVNESEFQAPVTYEEKMAVLREKTGLTDEQIQELTPEQLAEVAGGTDWLQTLMDSWKDLKHGVVDGWNEA